MNSTKSSLNFQTLARDFENHISPPQPQYGPQYTEYRTRALRPLSETMTFEKWT